MIMYMCKCNTSLNGPSNVGLEPLFGGIQWYRPNAALKGQSIIIGTAGIPQIILYQTLPGDTAAHYAKKY